MSDVGNIDLDKWIADLMECKPLSEQDVKRLCEKVIIESVYAGKRR